MPRVKRGGRELVISEAVVGEYLRNGYSLIDEQGNTIQPDRPMTYAQAMSENAALLEREAQLEAALTEASDALKAANERVKVLEAENDAFKASNGAQEPAGNVSLESSAPETETPQKPVSARKNGKSEK